jgi:hypothetical protein
MTILNQLSSPTGDRTEASNKRVAAIVFKEPALLGEIAEGLASTHARLAGDCAEVMTMVAVSQPELVAPYADALIARLAHKNMRVRWEVVHCLAEIAARVPNKIAPIMRTLDEMIALDKSVIVRDHAIRALGAYGSTSPAAARRVWHHLREALVLWEGKHAGKALAAMQKLVVVDATLKPNAQKVARRFVEHKRASVRTAARKLLKEAA